MIKNGYKPINFIGVVPIRSNDIFVLGFVVYLLGREHGRLLDRQARLDKFTPSNNSLFIGMVILDVAIAYLSYRANKKMQKSGGMVSTIYTTHPPRANALKS